MIFKQCLGLTSFNISNSIRYVLLSKLTAVRRWRNTALSQIFLHLQGFPLAHLHVQIFVCSLLSVKSRPLHSYINLCCVWIQFIYTLCCTQRNILYILNTYRLSPRLLSVCLFCWSLQISVYQINEAILVLLNLHYIVPSLKHNLHTVNEFYTWCVFLKLYS